MGSWKLPLLILKKFIIKSKFNISSRDILFGFECFIADVILNLVAIILLFYLMSTCLSRHGTLGHQICCTFVNCVIQLCIFFIVLKQVKKKKHV